MATILLPARSTQRCDQQHFDAADVKQSMPLQPAPLCQFLLARGAFIASTCCNDFIELLYPHCRMGSPGLLQLHMLGLPRTSDKQLLNKPHGGPIGSTHTSNGAGIGETDA